MKQLRNIVAPIFLLCLMLIAGLPVFAQTQEDVTPQEQKGEYGRCEGDRVRAYRRLIRMAYYDVG